MAWSSATGISSCIAYVFPSLNPYRRSRQRSWQDLKPNNLLIAANGQLKLADFGLARDFADPGYKMTCQVITRCVPRNRTATCRHPVLTSLQMVSATRAAVRLSLLQHRRRHLVRRLHLRRAHAPNPIPPRGDRHGPAQDHLPRPRHTNGRGVACKSGLPLTRRLLTDVPTGPHKAARLRAPRELP